MNFLVVHHQRRFIFLRHLKVSLVQLWHAL
jgi:hypothetical protein